MQEQIRNVVADIAAIRRQLADADYKPGQLVAATNGLPELVSKMETLLLTMQLSRDGLNDNRQKDR